MRPEQGLQDAASDAFIDLTQAAQRMDAQRGTVMTYEQAATSYAVLAQKAGRLKQAFEDIAAYARSQA